MHYARANIRGSRSRLGLLACFLLVACMGQWCDVAPDPDNNDSNPVDVPVSSDFSSGSEGWRTVDGDFPAPIAPQEGEGYVIAAAAGHWSWLAPNKYLGDLSLALGKAISFDVTARHVEGASCNYQVFHVLLSSASTSIYCVAGVEPSSVWTSYRVRLDESAGWLAAGTDDPVSNDIIRTVLSELTEFKIMPNVQACHKIESLLGRVVLGADIPEEQPKAVPVVSTFDASDEGWMVFGGDFTVPNATVVADDRLDTTAAGFWFWIAPQKFRGNLSNAYGQNIEFQMSAFHVNGASCSQRSFRVRLSGGGSSVYYLLPEAPSEEGTSYQIPLNEAYEWFDESTDDRVTGTQLRALLADLRQVQVLANAEACHTTQGTLDEFRFGQ